MFGLSNEIPDRFDTDLGAVGKAVLGGQNQRLALSQSLDPPSGRVRWTARISIRS